MTLFSDQPVEQEMLPYDGSALYLPQVLDPSSLSGHLQGLMDETPWESRNIILFGKQVAQPRLACWYGDVDYSYSGITLESRPWTPRVTELKSLCEEFSGSSFNSVLVNLYRDGNDSMGWHADDEKELGFEPIIASLTLGAERKFRLRHRQTKEIVHINLQSGSLLVMSGRSQHCWMHDLPKSKKISQPRINLTFRLIENMS